MANDEQQHADSGLVVLAIEIARLLALNTFNKIQKQLNTRKKPLKPAWKQCYDFGCRTSEKNLN